MAERRMFTKKVTDDDNFMALSASAQALYLHLSMAADDDGFCNQISISMFKAHASVQDLEALLDKRYIYQFENGVIVIKHWRMANALRKDRYNPTVFQDELKQLGLKDNGSYTRLPDGCQMVASSAPQVRLDKVRLDKDKKEKRFTPPALEEVTEYIREKDYKVDPEAFIDFYASKGWKVGNQAMKDWKAAVRTWARRDRKQEQRPAKNAPSPEMSHHYDMAELARRAKE